MKREEAALEEYINATEHELFLVHFTHNKVCSIRLQLVHGLELIEPRLCSRQSQCRGLLHQTKLRIDVRRLLFVTERVPVKLLTGI